MEDIILQNSKHQRVEISHLKTEVNETLRKFNASKQNLRHLSKPLPSSTSVVSSVTKKIEAVESLEKIIKQNFLETDKIILRLQKVQDINSRKFNWFLFIQTILFVLYLLSFWVHSIQGFHDYTRSL